VFLFLAPNSRLDKLNCPLAKTIWALVGNSILVIPKLCQLAQEVGEVARAMRLLLGHISLSVASKSVA